MGTEASVPGFLYFNPKYRAERIRSIVGAVSDRAYFVDSRKSARWDTAPTVDRMRFALL